MGDVSEDELLGQQFVKEPDLFLQVVYQRYSDSLFRFIYRFTGNRESAEEILHDTFIQLLSGKFKTDTQNNLKGWLFTTAKNKCLNHEKRNARASVLQLASIENQFERDAESLLVDKAMSKQLALAETRLPEDLNQTWCLRKDGLDYQQIAERLAIPLGTVKSRFSRLVEYLKKELSNEI